MRSALRSVGVAILALVVAVVLAFDSTMASLFTLTATTALIMGGAGHPLGTPPDDLPFVRKYRDVAVDNYINPATTPDVTKQVVVITPEQRLLGVGFDPFFSFDGFFDMTFDEAVTIGQANLDSCIRTSGCDYNQAASTDAPAAGDSFVVYGYSQSSTIATLEKRALAGGGLPVSFVLIANGNRPNGGILARGPQGLTIPIVGLTFSGPTPTDAGYPTVDISRQYDGWSDQPTNPLNLPAELNAFMGTYYLHQHYDDVDFNDAVLQDQVGDTSYYLIPTPILPLLIPLDQVPVVGHPLADTLDPVLRVMVEAGYDRATSPGQPTTWNLLYFPNPIEFGVNLVVAIPTGLDNGLQDVIGIRPLGTVRLGGPYGVGGPPVAIDATTTAAPATPYTPVQTTTATDASQQGPTNNSNTTGTPPVNTEPTPKPPKPLASLVTIPERPEILRGPIGGSPSLPSAQDIASSVKGIVTKTTTAITGAISRSPAQAGTNGSAG